MVSLFKQMYKYAIMYEICTENKAKYVCVNRLDNNVSGRPFSDQELKLLWNNKDNEDVQMILIMCYSGFRISAYRDLEVNLEKKYFKGGVKTAAGKGRIVPIHSSILPFVKERIKKYGSLLPVTTNCYRNKYFTPTLKAVSYTHLDVYKRQSMYCSAVMVSPLFLLNLIDFSLACSYSLNTGVAALSK